MTTFTEFRRLGLAFFLLLFTLLPVQGQDFFEVTELKCEYLSNPVGIDVEKPRLSWQLISSGRDVTQQAYRVRVASSEERLRSDDLVWNSGRVESAESVFVPYGGPSGQSGKRYYWQVKVWDQTGRESEWSRASFWEMGLLERSDWKAFWIRADLGESTSSPQPSPMLRRGFEIDGKNVARARIYVTSLGLYELHLNGAILGDQVFTPGWTSYKNRLQYQTYDVTESIRSGRNALGVVLGDGWYRGYIGFQGQRNYYGQHLGLRLQLEIEYEDGRSEFIASDEKWRSAVGPILFSDIYMGEAYDARLEIPGWDEPDFDDSKWAGVRPFQPEVGQLISPVGPPVRRVEEVHAVKILTTPEGDTVVDMGQNMVGRVRLKVQGPAGTTVTLRHAEVLDKEGNFYTQNLRTARQTVTYTLKGDGIEEYEPHFTFQGFRYVAVSGFPGNLSLGDLKGIVIHSDMAQAGSFESSHRLVNQLQHNIQWGQKGNFLDVPTDCPQRDERLGWTGDAQVFARTASFNMDVAGFFKKWLGDLAADQTEDGRIPHVVPDVLGGFASAGWADAGVIIPWTLYRAYGDREVLADQYESMKAWVEYMRRAAGEDLIWDQGFHFGDWLAYNTTRSDYPGATTAKDLIASAFFAHSTHLLSQTAQILGFEKDVREYGDLFRTISRAFTNEFVSQTGRVSSNTQTAYTLALMFDLLPAELRGKAAERLVEDIQSFDSHLTTGFLGTPYLCHVLSRHGYHEVAFDLLFQETYPSWLYPVRQGATTIWERWDGIKPNGSFQDSGMNSFNHYAYGAIGDWLYRVVAGIDTDPKEPGYRKILIDPHVGGDFQWVRARQITPFGEALSAWELRGEDLIVRVQIPANTSATVHLPGAKESAVREGGKVLEGVEGIHGINQGEDETVVEVGSGIYEFRYLYQNVSSP